MANHEDAPIADQAHLRHDQHPAQTQCSHKSIVGLSELSVGCIYMKLDHLLGVIKRDFVKAREGLQRQKKHGGESWKMAE